jgi:hypothetical protein
MILSEGIGFAKEGWAGLILNEGCGSKTLSEGWDF